MGAVMRGEAKVVGWCFATRPYACVQYIHVWSIRDVSIDIMDQVKCQYFTPPSLLLYYPLPLQGRCQTPDT